MKHSREEEFKRDLRVIAMKKISFNTVRELLELKIPDYRPYCLVNFYNKENFDFELYIKEIDSLKFSVYSLIPIITFKDGTEQYYDEKDDVAMFFSRKEDALFALKVYAEKAYFKIKNIADRYFEIGKEYPEMFLL